VVLSKTSRDELLDSDDDKALVPEPLRRSAQLTHPLPGWAGCAGSWKPRTRTAGGAARGDTRGEQGPATPPRSARPCNDSASASL